MPDPIHPLNFGKVPAEVVPCAGCGADVPRRWLVLDHWCEHCQSVRSAVDRVVTWRFDDDGRSTAVDPLQALGDLYVARAQINQLIQSIARRAAEVGIRWECIGARLRMDRRDAGARFQRQRRS